MPRSNGGPVPCRGAVHVAAHWLARREANWRGRLREAGGGTNRVNVRVLHFCFLV